MNFSYLQDDWAEFEKLFPQAYAWMVAQSLKREKEILTVELASMEDHLKSPYPALAILKRSVWIRGRLGELTTLSASS